MNEYICTSEEVIYLLDKEMYMIKRKITVLHSSECLCKEELS